MKYIISIICLIGMAGPGYAHAPEMGDEALVQGARLCNEAAAKLEKENDMPAHLIAAIAVQETGVYSQSEQVKLPWPWTMRAQGRGYYFSTQERAVAAARKMRARGLKNIYVGCMQIGLYTHRKEFPTIEDAFDPQQNVAFAARLLKEDFDDHGSWRRAVADYHTRSPHEGARYAGEIYAQRAKLVKADARSSKEASQ